MAQRRRSYPLTFEMPFADPRIERLIKEVASIQYGAGDVSDNSLYKMRRFASPYMSCEFDDLSWDFICTASHQHKLYVSSMILVFLLLKEPDWKSPYRTALENIGDVLEKAVGSWVGKRESGQKPVLFFCKSLFCGNDISRLICIYRKDVAQQTEVSTFLSQTSNKHVRLLIKEYFENKEKGAFVVLKALESREGVLAKTFDSTVPSFSSCVDITEEIFWKQVKFIKKIWGFEDNSYIGLLIDFYRVIRRTHDTELFRGSSLLDADFFNNQGLTRQLTMGCWFDEYTPRAYERIQNKPCCALVAKGYDKLYTTMDRWEVLVFNFSAIQEKSYLPLLWRYVLEETLQKNVALLSNIGAIVSVLNKLTELKRSEDYPNPDPMFINRPDCLALNSFIETAWNKYATKSSIRGTTRSFLRSSADKGLLEIEDLALRQLFMRMPDQQEDINETIADTELVRILQILDKESENNARALAIYTIVRILIDTEFRISMICSLKPSDIVKGFKDGEWYIRSNTKTSAGKTVSHVITEETAALLFQVIENTDELRASCDDPNVNQYIFIGKSSWFSRCFRYRASSFKDDLESILTKHGIGKRYTAIDFRNTHMTKAVQYCINNGLNEIAQRILTKHRSVITTMGNYYDTERAFIEQLMDTYNIEITPDLKAPGTVKDDISIPRSDIVADGCGGCTAEHCVIASGLSCKVCSHFVTTPAHLPFFEKSIKALTTLIENTEDEHRREDLLTMKAIDVLYVGKINIFMEEHKA